MAINCVSIFWYGSINCQRFREGNYLLSLSVIAGYLKPFEIFSFYIRPNYVSQSALVALNLKPIWLNSNDFLFTACQPSGNFWYKT
jgi:hypothetical protein